MFVGVPEEISESMHKDTFLACGVLVATVSNARNARDVSLCNARTSLTFFTFPQPAAFISAFIFITPFISERKPALGSSQHTELQW